MARTFANASTAPSPMMNESECDATAQSGAAHGCQVCPRKADVECSALEGHKVFQQPPRLPRGSIRSLPLSKSTHSWASLQSRCSDAGRTQTESGSLQRPSGSGEPQHEGQQNATGLSVDDLRPRLGDRKTLASGQSSGSTNFTSSTLHAVFDDFPLNRRRWTTALNVQGAMCDLPAGRTFSALYELGPSIGQGSFGEVRLCWDRVTGKQLAVKLMRKGWQGHGASDVDLSAMFRNETTILSALRHPNIVSLQAVFEGESTLYAVLEYCDSGDLFRYIHRIVRELHALRKTHSTQNGIKSTKIVRGCLSEVHVVALVRSMLETLHYLHQHRYVHRDIKAHNFLFCTSRASTQNGGIRALAPQAPKPERPLPKPRGLFRSLSMVVFRRKKKPGAQDVNLTGTFSQSEGFVDCGNQSNSERKRLVLIDFGMATFLPEGEVLRTLCGSPHYVAPEILKQRYGMEVDIWAFGVIVYLLIYGRYPFDSGDRNSILRLIETTVPEFPQSKEFGPSTQAINFLQCCFTRTPSQRITAAAALKHPWLNPVSADDAYWYPIIGLRSSKSPE